MTANGTGAFDPARLDDPIALKTEWTPAARGGASFRTHRLVEIDAGRLEFRATTGAIVFYLVFFVAGGGILGYALLAQPLRIGGSLNLDSLMMTGTGAIFAIAGGAMLVYGTRPLVFDRTRRWFWKGREEPNEFSGSSASGKAARFDTIHALQILAERVSSKNSSYHSYELNLVLHDGVRINVVDHGSQESIRRDAATLAALLGKPVWDAS